jgi:hypothetical protein
MKSAQASRGSRHSLKRPASGQYNTSVKTAAREGEGGGGGGRNKNTNYCYLLPAECSVSDDPIAKQTNIISTDLYIECRIPTVVRQA